MASGIRQRHRRVAMLIAVVIGAMIIAASEPLHRMARLLIETARPVIERHVIVGAIVFILLSALSAMVVFFSAAVITPVAVDAFGPLTAMLLLWFGWVIGGLLAYTMGRFLGRRVVSWFIEPRRLHEYERRAQRLVLFRHVLLFQLAVPSEVPGYVLGLAGCRFHTFAAAMALGELPFAIGAVCLGESFLDRNYLLLLALGIAGVGFSWLIFRRDAAIWASDGEPGDRSSTRGMVQDHQSRDHGSDESEVLTHAEGNRGV